MLPWPQLKAALEAAEAGDVAGVVAALAPKAPVDRALDEALGAACHCELGSAAWLLLAAGADSDCQLQRDEWQYRPIHAAAGAWRAECVAALLAHSADALAIDSKGRTALHCSSKVGTARRLLQAAPEAALLRDSEGRTPLQAAIMHDNSSLAQLFAAEAPLQPVPEILGTLREFLDLMSGVFGVTMELQQAVAIVPLLEVRLGLDMPQWYARPSLLPNPYLASVLPAVLHCSEAAAARLVGCLPPTDRQRLRTLALCLGRIGDSLSAPLPGLIVRSMLVHAAERHTQHHEAQHYAACRFPRVLFRAFKDLALLLLEYLFDLLRRWLWPFGAR